MKRIFKGFTYSFHRTIAGIVATAGTIYFFKTNSVAAIALAVLAAAQFWTVLSAKCIICYFAEQCTISANERNQLSGRGIEFQK